MAAVNGVSPSASPQPPDTVALSSKRKHDDIISEAIVNGENTSNDRHLIADIHNSLRDIWFVLGAREGVPATAFQRISSYEITRNSSDQEIPSNKRQKLSPASSDNTIASKISHGRYDSFEAFIDDVGSACSDFANSSQSEDTDNLSAGMYKPLLFENSEHQRLQDSMASFKKIVYGLVRREEQRLRLESHTGHEAPISKEDGVKVNGTQNEPASAHRSPPEQSHRAVLTTFGNAQAPKQLFSSFQKPLAKSNNSGHSEDAWFEAGSDLFTSAQEASLPVGLSRTTIIPKPKDTEPQITKARRTFQDLFAPPSTVRSLAPPKTPKVAPSREYITWSKGSSTESSSRPTRSSDERLATGAWLGYGGLAPAEEPSSPQAKRKQRDRALSSGEASSTPSHDLKAAQLQAEEEALFRSAYASFAPSRDNSAALVPEEVRNEVWWDKYGSKQFQQMFDADNLIESDDNGDVEGVEADKEARFREAVENFEPPNLPKEESKQSFEEREADEMLLEVSQMLETLHSYQRIRMSSLSTSSRTGFVHTSQLQDLTGNPSTPSSAEVETYKTLKAQLALIVSMLPPYAIAKLNGDQLADLQISTEIPIEVEEYSGVMEEDKASRGAKQAALQAAVGSAANNRPSPLHPPSHQARNSQMSPASARGSGANHIQYGSNPQSIARSQPHFSRQSLSNWQKPNQNIAATTQRPAYANAQNFNQQISRNPPTPVRQPYTPITQNRPAGYQQLSNGTSYSNTQYYGQQRIQPHTSTSQMSGGAFGPSSSSSPPKSMHQNYQAHLQNSTPLYRMQTPYASQTSPSKGVGQIPPSPQHAATIQSPSIQPTPVAGLAPTLAASPTTRPTSSGGPAPASTSGETDGVAVTSRTSTPATSNQIQTQPQPQAPAVANMTSA